MNSIEKQLNKLSSGKNDYTPVILDLSKSADKKKLEKMISKGIILHVVDDFEEQLLELFGINNPSIVYEEGFKEKFQLHLKLLKKQKPLIEHGRWVYYSWLDTVVHVLEENDFITVRTARNRNLINNEEQKAYYDAVVGIAGLSVGNSLALSLALQGGARHMKLADFDSLALTNTNRIRTGVQSLGLMKVVMTARQIYEINPYAFVELFTDGITEKNIKDFFIGTQKLTVVADEMDNLALKCLIRENASRYRIPVVMGADNGDNAVIDIERYDEDPKIKFFHGRMGDVSYKSLLNLDKFAIGKLITKLVGPENVTERMQQSLLEMGKTIVSWPQLGGAALLNGIGLAYVIRKIATGQKVESDRSLLILDEQLTPDYNSSSAKKMRAQGAAKFKKIFGL